MAALAKRALQVGLGSLIGVAVGLGALALALRDADLNEIQAAFERAGLLTVVLGTLVHVAVQLVYAVRWRLLLDSAVGIPRLFGIVAIGYLANYTLPGRPGELVRAALARGLGGVPLVVGMSSLVLEKVLDGGTILLSAGVFVVGGPDWLRSAATTGAAVLAGALGAFAVVARVARTTPARVPAFVRHRLVEIAAPARELAQPGRLLPVFGLGLVSWLLILTHQAIICTGVGTGTGPASWLLLYAALGLASVVPGAPGYVGTYQLAAVLSLSVFGVEREPAIVVATLYQASRLLGALVVSIWALAREAPAVRRAL